MKKQWSESEIEFLKQNYEEKTCEEIAKELNRSTKSVQHKFGELKLKRRKARVGDVVNGWLIQDIYIKYCGNQNISFAKIKSTLNDATEKEERLTKLTLGQIGWPDKRRPDNIIRNTTHGLSKSRLYRIWYGMKNRCYNKKQVSYENYGAKGITICEDWKNSFEKFKAWAESNGYREELTLDRKDVNKNYCPDNCRWSTWTEQSESKNNAQNLMITAFGETKSVYKWIHDPRCVLDRTLALTYRIKAGWEPEKAITQKSERKNAKKIDIWLQEKYPNIYNEYLLTKND